MLGTSQFFIGCMKWQNAVILEPISERDWIIIFLPAQRTGLLTPLLTCFTLLFLSPFFGQLIPSPTPLLPFTLLDKIILSPILLPFLFGQNNSKSKFPLLFAFPGLKILSPTQNLQKYSKSHFPSDLEKFPLFAYPSPTRDTGV